MCESYRPYSRINNRAPTFVQIAVENYYQAKKEFDKIKTADFSQLLFEELCAMENYVTVTIVFSAMALEACFNDYAAWRLGDDQYYDSFDKLAPVDKLNLIVQFIFHSKVDKGLSYYSHIKTLFRRRNELVHSKSKDFSNPQDESMREKHADKMIKVSNGKYDRIQIQGFLRTGLEALLAIKEVAQLFDQCDDKAFTTLLLFNPQIFRKAETQEDIIKENVYRDLGIEIQYFREKTEE